MHYYMHMRHLQVTCSIWTCVSRLQCSIRWEAERDELVLVDEGHNGTYVDGVRAPPYDRVVLRHGARVSFGRSGRVAPSIRVLLRRVSFALHDGDD